MESVNDVVLFYSSRFLSRQIKNQDTEKGFCCWHSGFPFYVSLAWFHVNPLRYVTRMASLLHMYTWGWTMGYETKQWHEKCVHLSLLRPPEIGLLYGSHQVQICGLPLTVEFLINTLFHQNLVVVISRQMDHWKLKSCFKDKPRKQRNHRWILFLLC